MASVTLTQTPFHAGGSKAVVEDPDALSDGFRRMSIDSGVCVSGSPPACEISASSSDSGCGSMAPAEEGASNPLHHRGQRKKKKRLKTSLSATRFSDAYETTGQVLGQGSYGRVETCRSKFTDAECAVKIVSKKSWAFSRSKIFKEIELYYLCQGRMEIIQLVEYFEEEDLFYLIFEKAFGGPLLDHIRERVRLTEQEASLVIRDLAEALSFLHQKGIAHRDLKPENVLCLRQDSPHPVKLCDFDLCSAIDWTVSTPRLQSPVGSAEYMAPEVVEAFDFDLDDAVWEEDLATDFTYDKRCDLWSLGIIAYILLCGYPPFRGRCGQDCGWDDRDQACTECQHRLFRAIKNATVVFPEPHWASISDQAKDLITKLLVRNASDRLDASSVLKHPWVVSGAAGNNQATPEVWRHRSQASTGCPSPPSLRATRLPSRKAAAAAAVASGDVEEPPASCPKAADQVRQSQNGC